MKTWLALALLSGSLLSCQALLDPAYPDIVRDVTSEVQRAIETKADAGEVLSREEVQALVQQLVDIHTRGTPLEGGATGALVASILGLLGAYFSTKRQLAREAEKNSRKRGEMWAAIEEVRAPKG